MTDVIEQNRSFVGNSIDEPKKNIKFTLLIPNFFIYLICLYIDNSVCLKIGYNWTGTTKVTKSKQEENTPINHLIHPFYIKLNIKVLIFLMFIHKITELIRKYVVYVKLFYFIPTFSTLLSGSCEFPKHKKAF